MSEVESSLGQAVVNVGVVGHVDHGKTTLVHAITGEWTDRHSEEIKRGISIKLGYSDVTVFKCPKCPELEAYTTRNLSPDLKCAKCGGDLTPVRKISFVDAPGHEVLMATVLSGSSLMDGALLIIAANEKCPQPQTREHLAVLQITGIKNIVIVQNKAELVSEKEALENYKQIKEFVKGTVAENAPIIPTSAILKKNVDVLLYAIQKYIPTPQRDDTKPLLMYVTRSFDVNKPGCEPQDLQGGVLGGSILQGKLSVGDIIEIRPGIKIDKPSGSYYAPITTTVRSLQGGGVELKEARPGGLIGVGTKLDPSLTKADGLIGNVIGHVNNLPPVIDEITISVNLMQRAVGTNELVQVENIQLKEPLMVNIGAAVTIGVVTKISNNRVTLKLKRPVCSETNQRIAISRQIKGRWRLIGWGELI
ncbi:MAG: translation initiation factor IF-2 subunit gamma [Candidatus Odinarchaeum yellowstonii]|uniref:protein-synthesizing GTPase n=1 Tax=Odinarchaeota yellowstonii (strain LCB_4) TaxID=1841599 RepID=A0AAF0I9M2_ODILC|nr:MAG: translation initiation factor IF-2 subunit gamma [Candidatus Odinarchaeum yellowstonii]